MLQRPEGAGSHPFGELKTRQLPRELGIRFAFVCFVLTWREDALHVLDGDTLPR
jgi:hypothetical protein